MRTVKIYLEEGSLVFEDLKLTVKRSSSTVVRFLVGDLYTFKDTSGVSLFEADSFDLDHIKDSAGDAYTQSNFDKLFTTTINLTPLTDGTQKTKVLNAAGDTINPATSENITSLIAAVQGSGGTQLKSFEVEITRPSNQTPYSAGDVIADTTAAFIPFANVAKAIGTGVKIIRVRIQTEDTSVAGLKFNVHLYKEAPTFIADNAAFAISYANASKRIGAIPVVMGSGSLGTVGMNDYNQMITNPTARDIYFIIETVSAFTSSANSTKFKVVIDCELSNN